jgi:hypothetical protein
VGAVDQLDAQAFGFRIHHQRIPVARRLKASRRDCSQRWALAISIAASPLASAVRRQPAFGQIAGDGAARQAVVGEIEPRQPEFMRLADQP